MNEIPAQTKTPSRRERRKKRTRRRLLEAADAFFREQGFEATTVEEIAAVADVAKGTFFNYFENKEALLVALITERVEEALNELPATDEPAPERVRRLLRAVGEVLFPYRHLSRRMFSHNVGRPSHPKRPLLRRLVVLIREGQQQGAFRPEVDAEIAALLLTAHFFRSGVLCDRARETTIRSWEECLEQGLDILYHGLLPDP